MLVWEVISPQVQDLAFSILQHHDVPVGPFLQTVQVPLNISTHLSFELSANLLRLHSRPTISRPLIKLLNSTGLSLNPCRIPIVTTLHQLRLEPVTTTLGAWQFRQLSISLRFEVHASSGCLRMLQMTVSKPLLKWR